MVYSICLMQPIMNILPVLCAMLSHDPFTHPDEVFILHLRLTFCKPSFNLSSQNNNVEIEIVYS